MDFLPTDDLSEKTIHNDFWCGYYTLPAIHSFFDCRNGAELKQIAVDIKKGLYSELTDKRIAELINDSDGFGYTLTMIDQYAKEAEQSLNVFKDSIARQKLLELVDTVQLSAHRIVSDYLSDFPLKKFAAT